MIITGKVGYYVPHAE